MVLVKLFAQFRKERFKTKEIPAGVTALAVLKELDITAEEVGSCMINSRHAELDTLLNDGDTCSLFPKVGGG